MESLDQMVVELTKLIEVGCIFLHEVQAFFDD